MAVGARITSENLSGKTATVTFIPYTGSTSGTTQNLGTKVIPFNNITSHPYGVYNLYFAEYDYTYTLTVDQPLIESQMFVHVNRMVGSDNYGAATLNFTDLTAEIIDLDVDSTYWNTRDAYPLTESGFGYYFNGRSNGNERLVIFTDASNVEVGRYTGTTEDYDLSSLEGKWITFEDEDNGILKYFNGTDVYTYTWDNSTHYIDIEWEYDSVMGDGSFILKKWVRGGWEYNGDGASFIMKSDGTVIPFKTWTDGTFVEHNIATFVDFIVVDTRNQETGLRSSLEIFDTDGNSLELISLTGNSYNSIDFTFLGTDKMCAVIYNYDDVNVDYKIIHYNHTTETLTETSHVRGSNYPNISITGDESFWPSNVVDGSVAILLHKYTQGLPGYNFAQRVSYCDIVYMLNGQTGFTTYSFIENGDGAINMWTNIGNTYKSICSTTGNTVGVLTISTSGTSITDLEMPISGITYGDFYKMQERGIVYLTTNEAIDVSFYLISEDGSVLDSLDPILNTNYNYSLNTNGTVGYVRFTTSDNQDFGYYVYSGSTGFTSTEHYNTIQYPTDFYTPTFLDPSRLLLWNPDQLGYRVLSNNGISSLLSFPEYYGEGLGIRLGADKYMVVYADADTSVIKINLYNLTGTLLNSHTTEYNNWDYLIDGKDRFVVVFQGDGTKEFFLVSEETITSVTLEDFDSEEMANDYIWWDD